MVVLLFITDFLHLIHVNISSFSSFPFFVLLSVIMVVPEIEHLAVVRDDGSPAVGPGPLAADPLRARPLARAVSVEPVSACLDSGLAAGVRDKNQL